MKKKFQCQECGNIFFKWVGKCSNCGGWHSLIELLSEDKPVSDRLQSRIIQDEHFENKPYAVNMIPVDAQQRISTNMAEINRVLGGGVVPGSFLLIGGDPGIGKSTLVLQVMAAVAQLGHKVLYVSGEESLQQIKIRADRLEVNQENLFIFAETRLEKIKEVAKSFKPSFLVVDSIQAIFTAKIESTPGTVSQIRECAAELMIFAKSYGVATFLIGHVTKDGAIAGPKVLEHLVDTVLYFEGDSNQYYRILRTIKNRFGPTNEIAIFDMHEKGLKEVVDPSSYFLSDRSEPAVGSCALVTIEGTRPIMIEVQTLVSSTHFGNPRRNSLGVDLNRLNMILAMLEKKQGYGLSGHDIFINIAGGLKINDPGTDLGIVAAISSSYLNQTIELGSIFVGEVGLAGEVRPVSQMEVRVAEIQKLGFKRIILPMKNKKHLQIKTGPELIFVENVENALNAVF